METTTLNKPYEKCDTIKMPSALPIALWAFLLFGASIWLTLLNSAQQVERQAAIKNELDELRRSLTAEKIETVEVRNKAEKLADTLRSMGWTPPAELTKQQ